MTGYGRRELPVPHPLLPPVPVVGLDLETQFLEIVMPLNHIEANQLDEATFQIFGNLVSEEI